MNKKIALLVLLIAPSLYAKENRCGWLENPTPGNYWLTDKDGDWTISTQGKEGPTGMEYLVGFPSKEFINTNNSYGYGCGCILSEASKESKEITRIFNFKALPLRVCKTDPSLREKTEEIENVMNDNWYCSHVDKLFRFLQKSEFFHTKSLSISNLKIIS